MRGRLKRANSWDCFRKDSCELFVSILGGGMTISNDMQLIFLKNC